MFNVMPAMRSAGGIASGAALFPDDTDFGAISHLEIAADSSGMRFGAPDDITLELWAYPLAFVSSRQPLVKRVSGSSLGYALGFNATGTDVEFQYGRTGGGTTRYHDRPHGLGSLLNKWTHIAATRDTSTGTTTLYANGVQIGSQLVQDATEFNDLVSGTTYIGGTTSNASDFYGYIAEVRVWDALRTPTEILNNYNVALVGNEANLVAYLQMISDFNDLTANGNDFSAVAGAGQPAPTIEPIARPF